MFSRVLDDGKSWSGRGSPTIGPLGTSGKSWLMSGCQMGGHATQACQHRLKKHH
jgi:hypothetical protein